MVCFSICWQSAISGKQISSSYIRCGRIDHLSLESELRGRSVCTYCVAGPVPSWISFSLLGRRVGLETSVPDLSELVSESDDEVTVVKTILGQLQVGLGGQFASLCLSFSICKMGLIIGPPYGMAGRMAELGFVRH